MPVFTASLGSCFAAFSKIPPALSNIPPSWDARLGGCFVCVAGIRTLLRAKLKRGGIIRPPKQGPLAGIKVLDLSVVIAGPWSAAMMAELGAEVIKVETLTLPDSSRGLGTSPALGMAGCTATVSRGKQSIMLDLKQEEGKEVFLKLVKECDILLQNYRPGAMKRLGIDYESLVEVNPDIIFCSSSGYGPSGPLSDNRIYDPVIQAMSGMASVQGKDANGDPPSCKLVAQAIVDKSTAQFTLQAILSALAAREMGKGGQHIEVSMLDVALGWMWPDGFVNHTWVGAQCPPVAGVIDQMTQGHAMLERTSPVPPFNSKDDAMKEMKRMGVLMMREHTLFGKFKTCKYPVNFTSTPVSKVGPPAAPMMGEHTAKLLRELGYSRKQITNLLATKAAMSTKSLLQIKNMAGKAKIFGYVEKLQGGYPTFKKAKYRRVARKPAEAQAECPKRIKRGFSVRAEDDSLLGGALSGIKVLDCTSFVAGPMAACILADQGADVVKLEAVAFPDPSRGYGQAPANNMGSMHMALNRNKKSIVVDHTKKEGKDVMMKLAADADIILVDADSCFVNAGLTYSAVKRRKATSIFITLKKVPELICQARSGMVSTQVDARNDPCFAQFLVAEKNAAMYTASAASASLFVRETGRGGQYVEVDMMNAAFHACFPDVFWSHVWEKPKGTPKFPDVTEAYRLLTTKGDGVSFYTGALTDKEWESMVSVFMDKHKVMPALSAEQREKWSTIAGRLNNIGELWQLLEDYVKLPTSTYTDLSKLTKEADLINGKACSLPEACDLPQVKHNKIIGEYDVPGIGKLKLAQPTAVFSRTPASIRTMASRFGADSETVLQSLGYDAEQISILLRSGAVQKSN